MDDACMFLYHLLQWKKQPQTVAAIRHALHSQDTQLLQTWIGNAAFFEYLPELLSAFQMPDGVWNSGVEFCNRGYWPGSYVIYDVWEQKVRTEFVEPQMSNQDMLNELYNHNNHWTHVFVKNNNHGCTSEQIQNCWEKLLYCQTRER